MRASPEWAIHMAPNSTTRAPSLSIVTCLKMPLHGSQSPAIVFGLSSEFATAILMASFADMKKYLETACTSARELAPRSMRQLLSRSR
jgi:hypothetical protein